MKKRLTTFITSIFCLATFASELQVNELTGHLARPWAVDVLPDNTLVISERRGQLRLWQNNQLSKPITGLPEVYNAGQGGLLDVLVDDNFKSNNTIYVSFSEGDKEQNGTSVISAKLINNQLQDLQYIYRSHDKKSQAYHYAGRLALLPNNQLAFAIGDGYFYKERAQNLDSDLGKFIRINRDGSVPKNNPFQQSNQLPQILSYGHRNPQGVYYDSKRQVLFSHEHGPKGGDEINLIDAGKNYGWPEITYGIDYSGDIISEFTHKEGMEQPLLHWTPSIAPSSLVIYQGKLFPQWQSHMLVTTLKQRELRLVKLAGDGKQVNVQSQQSLIPKVKERFRDITIGNHGELYLITDSGKLIKITPAK